MNTEENDNHILIEVLNKNGDLKLTKFRNPRAIWQNNDYPDEYTFRDVDIVNVFQLQQENKQLKEHIEKYEHYCKTTGIEELMKENQKYKEVIDKAIEYLETKRIREKAIIDIDVLEGILKEVE